MEPRKPYPTDLNDKQWDLIKNLVPNANPESGQRSTPSGNPERTSEAMIRVAMIHLMIRRLARTMPY